MEEPPVKEVGHYKGNENRSPCPVPLPFKICNQVGVFFQQYFKNGNSSGVEKIMYKLIKNAVPKRVIKVKEDAKDRVGKIFKGKTGPGGFAELAHRVL